MIFIRQLHVTWCNYNLILTLINIFPSIWGGTLWILLPRLASTTTGVDKSSGRDCKYLPAHDGNRSFLEFLHGKWEIGENLGELMDHKRVGHVFIEYCDVLWIIHFWGSITLSFSATREPSPSHSRLHSGCGMLCQNMALSGAFPPRGTPRSSKIRQFRCSKKKKVLYRVMAFNCPFIFRVTGIDDPEAGQSYTQIKPATSNFYSQCLLFHPHVRFNHH